MAFLPPEMDNEESARVDKAVMKWLGGIAARLRVVKFESRHERQFVDAIDQRLNIEGRMPIDHDIERIKGLAWKYRRKLPPHVAPKLPPHDPIVQEMEKNGG